MATPKSTKRADSILGTVCGLGLAAAGWAVYHSPTLLDPAYWMLVVCGLPLGLTRLRGSHTLRRLGIFVLILTSLLLFGTGAAVLTHIILWLVGQLDRRGRRIGPDGVIRAVYDLAARGAMTLLAALGYLAVGGVVPLVPGVTAWLGVASFAALYTAADRVSLSLAGEAPVAVLRPRTWPGWPLSLAGHAAGAVAAAGVGMIYHVWPAAVWGVPLALVLTWMLGGWLGSARRRRVRLTGPVDRAIARAIAVSLADDTAPALRTRRLCRVALDLGRSAQMTDAQLDTLEIAAWLSELDRLQPPPPPRHWPEARRFGKAPPRCDTRAVLERLGLPESVSVIVTHLGEHWDGTGDPAGLCGARIPVGARVLGVARDFVSMTTPGNGRHALSEQRALAELRQESGRAFDPRIVDALCHEFAGRRIRGDDESPDRPETDGPHANVNRRDPERLGVVRDELSALYGISGCGRLPVDLDETLVLMFEKLKGLIPHVTAAVWVLDEEQTGLRPRFVRGAGETALRPLSISAGRSFTGRVARQRRTASFQQTGLGSDVVFDLDGVTHEPVLNSLRAALAAPLVTEQGCCGALTLYDRVGRRFDTAEQRTLVAVAAHVAKAVAEAPPKSEPVLDSLTDPLTGLPNGRYLEIFAADLTPHTPSTRSGYGLLAFRVRDLDRVYERAGVAAGERLLGVLARTLAAHCDPSEVPVRFGHDLFLVLSPVAAPDELVRRWDSLLRAAEGSVFELPGGQIHRPRLVSAHAGCPVDGADLDELLDVLGTRLGLAFDRGHKVVPFRAVRSTG